MMPPKFEADGKKILLQLILQKKDILFGNFDESKGITKERRREAWNEIHADLSGQGYPVGKDGNYVRDTTFGNLKKRTLVSWIQIYCYLIRVVLSI